jgi:hypothetical protein
MAVIAAPSLHTISGLLLVYDMSMQMLFVHVLDIRYAAYYDQ